MATFSINANLLKGVALFHGKDSARTPIFGVAVWLTDTGVITHVVATDSYQMVVAEMRDKGTAWQAPKGEPTVFIPGELIAKAPKVTKAWPYLQVETYGDSVSLSNGDETAKIKQPRTAYPPVEHLVSPQDAMVQREDGWGSIGFNSKFMERTGKAVNTVFGSSAEIPVRFLGHPNAGSKFSPTFWEATGIASGDEYPVIGSWSLLIVWMPVKLS